MLAARPPWAEMGAIGGVLTAAVQAQRAPLALVSNKSCYGHTEGAAGLTGLLLALAVQQKGLLPPLVNLRELNPHVASALGDWRSRHGLAAAVPRQAGPAPAAAAAAMGTEQLAGTSSFGMSGVNAHMLLSVPARLADRALPQRLRLPWQRQRHWPLPSPHALLARCLPIGDDSVGQPGAAVLFACELSSCRAAFLHDHCVSGRRLVPATALLELILAAGAALREDSAQSLPSLAGVAIQAHKLLSGAGPAGLLRCRVGTRTGAAELASADGTAHVRASFVAMESGGPAPAALAGSPSTLPMLGLRRAAEQAAGPARWYNFARLAASAADEAAWLAHPAAADAALHLSAVKVTGLTDSASRVPVGMAAVRAAPASRPGLGRQQWSASELPRLADSGGAAECSVRATLALGGCFTAAGLNARPLPAQKAAANAGKLTQQQEQQRFTYSIQWQAAAAATLSPSAGRAPWVHARGAGLSLTAPGQLHGGAASWAEALGGARTLCLLPDLGCRGGGVAAVAAAAGGVELLQRILACGRGGGVHAVGMDVATLPAAHGGSGSSTRTAASSAILAALVRVAAVEEPERGWGAASVCAQHPGFSAHYATLVAVGSAGAAAGNGAHGAHCDGGTLSLPVLLRQPMCAVPLRCCALCGAAAVLGALAPSGSLTHAPPLLRALQARPARAPPPLPGAPRQPEQPGASGCGWAGAAAARAGGPGSQGGGPQLQVRGCCEVYRAVGVQGTSCAVLPTRAFAPSRVVPAQRRAQRSGHVPRRGRAAWR